MRYPNVTSLYFAFNAADDLCKILPGGQRVLQVQNGEKYCRKFQPPA